MNPALGEESVGMRRSSPGNGVFPIGPLMPKVEIPQFDVQNSRWWVRRYDRVFSLYNVADTQKMMIAAAHLNDVGDAWYHGWIRVKGDCAWEEFVEGLCE